MMMMMMMMRFRVVTCPSFIWYFLVSCLVAFCADRIYLIIDIWKSLFIYIYNDIHDFRKHEYINTMYIC